jgi:hypothetical protein
MTKTFLLLADTFGRELDMAAKNPMSAILYKLLKMLVYSTSYLQWFYFNFIINFLDLIIEL